MIASLFAFPSTRARYMEAPLLKEREEYLLHLQGQGRNYRHLRGIAAMMLNSVKLLNLVETRSIDQQEIANASARWQNDEKSNARKRGRKNSAYNFSRITAQWLRFHGLLVEIEKPELPFEALVNSYLVSIQFTRGLSPITIANQRSRLLRFQKWCSGNGCRIENVSLNNLDSFLACLQAEEWRPRSIASASEALRGFFRFCEAQQYCAQGIARGILSPRTSKREVGPRGPAWSDVRRLLRLSAGRSPVELRAKAIISLCSIYGLRRGEVVRLRLKDFDWVNETMTIQRLKRGRLQQFPIQYEVGEAILRYLQFGRPQCDCPYLFTTVITPYRPMTAPCIWKVVSKRMKRLGIESENRGPHSLRHACATKLLRAGSSMRSIAEFLGHRSLSAVSIYAKYDPRLLRRVAGLSLAGLQ